MATIDDGVIRARVVVDERGCVPFWLPSGYETRAQVTCYDTTMSHVLSDRMMSIAGRNYPLRCSQAQHSDRQSVSSAALFAHGFYNSSSTVSGIWHSACLPPEVACAPGGGSSVRIFGDSVLTQQMEHWVESFWDGSQVTVSMTAGSNARDRGTRSLGHLTGYDQIRAATSEGLNGLSVLIADHSEGRFGFTGGLDANKPADDAVERLVTPWRSKSTAQLQASRILGSFGLYPLNATGFNATVFGAGYHQTFSYTQMRAFIGPLFQRIADAAPGHRWIYVLNFSPNSTSIPNKFKDQRHTRTTLQTWWANRAVLEEAQAHPMIEVADLFSPELVLNEFVHGRKFDAVHLLGGDVNGTADEGDYLRAEAEAMRLTLLSRMCRGDPLRIRYGNRTLVR